MNRGKKRIVRSALITLTAMAAITALAGCSVVSPDSAAASPAFRVTGYAEAGDTSFSQLSASRKALTSVGVDGVNLTADGAGISAVSSSALNLLHESRALGKKAELLVGNFSADKNDFDDALAEKMFDSPDNIASVVAALKAEVKKHGWDGITIDLEALNSWGADGHTRDDNAGLAAFVTAVKQAIGNRSVSIALTATTGSYTDLGYNVKAIAASADHLVLMAYDQHGPTWSASGPVGGYPWVAASLKPLTRTLPNSRIQLGIAGYGYSWPGDGSDGTQFTDAAARAFVARHHGTAKWDATQKEWHATLADGTRIWWSDARSYRARVALAKAQHLGGVAVWSLAASDPLR